MLQQKLAIEEVLTVSEVEPAIVEVQVRLADNSIATLRMNVFAAQKLRNGLAQVTGG